jgi:succinate dehydrogenase / fumarate reductase cytochrome b subunit
MAADSSPITRLRMADTLKHRPVYRNIHISQLPSYRLPAAGWTSILHRISGAVLFLLLPFLIWLFDTSVTSEVSFERFTAVFHAGLAGIPGWIFKLVAVLMIWAYVQHFIGGLRHLWMDMTHAVDLEFGRVSALVTNAAAALVTLVLGIRLFL